MVCMNIMNFMNVAATLPTGIPMRVPGTEVGTRGDNDWAMFTMFMTFMHPDAPLTSGPVRPAAVRPEAS
jgi:hypothetical protein